MITRQLSRASAIVLAAGGIALLFAADDILPRLVPGFPVAAAWLGQLVAAGWLAVAALDWLGQSALLGGIYGRAQVMANLALYFMSATSLLRVAMRGDAPAAVWIALVVSIPFAAAYGWLLFRGPLERDLAAHRGAP